MTTNGIGLRGLARLSPSGRLPLERGMARYLPGPLAPASRRICGLFRRTLPHVKADIGYVFRVGGIRKTRRYFDPMFPLFSCRSLIQGKACHAFCALSASSTRANPKCSSSTASRVSSVRAMLASTARSWRASSRRMETLRGTDT